LSTPIFSLDLHNTLPSAILANWLADFETFTNILKPLMPKLLSTSVQDARQKTVIISGKYVKDLNSSGFGEMKRGKGFRFITELERSKS
jgi:hypothetical protein